MDGALGWREFERLAPGMAAAGHLLLFHPGFGFGYLATIAPTGAPRLHPIDPLIHDGRLLAFITPSPKLRDLRSDGRYALHSSQTESVNDEFLLIGEATVLNDDAALRSAALEDHPLSVGDDHVLVEFAIRYALLVHYPAPGAPREVTRWTSSGSASG